MLKIRLIGICLFLLVAGCSAQSLDKTKSIDHQKQEVKAGDAGNKEGRQTSEETKQQNGNTNAASKTEAAGETSGTAKPAGPSVTANTVPKQSDDAIHVVARPESIYVLINKQNKLPDKYNPKDLVTTSIPFINGATPENHKMRRTAALAIAKLFAGAKKQGVILLGVSAYRSHATQTAVFNSYVRQDGYEKARTYSAVPGTSEHETGLAIDVTSGNGKCAVDDCFGGTVEAKWLQHHAADYGFIIRYPKGKEAITGYQYEPWHLRYVGKTIAKEIMSKGITLEEYDNAIPVNK